MTITDRMAPSLACEAAAAPRELDGWTVAAHYGEPAAEAHALANGAAALDFGFLRVLRAEGRDAADYLNRRLCQKTIDLHEGEARRAALLDAVGKMQADLTILRRGEELWLIAPPWQGDGVAGLIDRFIFSEDCRIVDATEEWACLATFGVEEPLPSADTRLAHELVPGGWLHLVPRSAFADVWQSVGVPHAGFDAYDAWRIAGGVPWWGRDIDTGTIPLEADLESALHFDKGCYPGQETIAKISNLGHPARKLVRLEADESLTPGATLATATGTETGRVTSACGTIGLGWVKWLQRAPGTELTTADGVRARVLALNPHG